MMMMMMMTSRIVFSEHNHDCLILLDAKWGDKIILCIRISIIMTCANIFIKDFNQMLLNFYLQVDSILLTMVFQLVHFHNSCCCHSQMYYLKLYYLFLFYTHGHNWNDCWWLCQTIFPTRKSLNGHIFIRSLTDFFIVVPTQWYRWTSSWSLKDTWWCFPIRNKEILIVVLSIRWWSRCHDADFVVFVFVLCNEKECRWQSSMINVMWSVKQFKSKLHIISKK